MQTVRQFCLMDEAFEIAIDKEPYGMGEWASEQADEAGKSLKGRLKAGSSLI
ncbi:MAG: hypothetical protein ACTSVF_00695 [Candidatus Asgardarchaeia archaeon]